MLNENFFGNLNRLIYFYLVGKTKSYTKAADKLCITEPAVHAQVRSLERSLECKLLDMRGKELELTESGKTLYDYAEKIFCLIEEAASKIGQQRSLQKGSLRLATSRTLAHFIPTVISSFHNRYPEIKIILNESRAYDIPNRILHDRYDVGIMGRVPYPPLIDAICLTRLEMLVIVSPRHKFAKRESISLYELVNEPLVARAPGSVTRVIIAEAFRKRGLKPLVMVEVDSVELIKNLVREGDCYSFLSQSSLGEEIETGELIPFQLKEERIFVYVDAVYKRNQALPSPASAFLSFLEEGARNHSEFMRHVQSPSVIKGSRLGW